MEEPLKQEAAACLKVVLFGPESTGKTTLAKQLAGHFNTLWVPEYMREYLQEKWDSKQEKCTREDLMPIAEGQMKLENETAKLVDELLICDTNLLEIKVYSEHYYNGFCPLAIDKFAKENAYDLYLLTFIDVPWKIDNLRDSPDEREEMFCTFETQLTNYHLQFEILKGSEVERFNAAVEIITKLLKKNKNAHRK
jgi:HTH-type transcriptional repressor of NAD biosynthesis genes